MTNESERLSGALSLPLCSLRRRHGSAAWVVYKQLVSMTTAHNNLQLIVCMHSTRMADLHAFALHCQN